MLDDYDVTPQSSTVLRKRHQAISDGMNILAQVSVATTVTIPVFARVNSQAVFLVELRRDVPPVITRSGCQVLVRALSICVTYSEVKTVGGRDIGTKVRSKRVLG